MPVRGLADQGGAREVAALLRVSKQRKRRAGSWCWPVSGADPMDAAYVLILALGLRRGQALGVRWVEVDLDAEEIRVGWQIQRINGRLLHRKTEASDAALPLVGICTAALRQRAKDQDAAWEAFDEWADNGLVVTTRTGQPIEPRNFNRSSLWRVPVHVCRKTCASLLVALDVHPRVVMQILRHKSDRRDHGHLQRGLDGGHARGALRRIGKQLG